MRAEAPKEPRNDDSALVKAAQQAERRATQAYQSGDVASAADGFEAALRVYDSLALADSAARARLSLARALGDLGHTQAALTLTRAVLTVTTLDPGARITAHGRLAALQTSSNTPEAVKELAQAESLCASTCVQSLALANLRARVELAQGNATQAVQSATRALQLAQAVNDTSEQANALRTRAQAQRTLGAHAQVVADAQTALPLDQQLGNAARVLQDLELLVAAHRALGNTNEAQRYELLMQRAQAAQR